MERDPTEHAGLFLALALVLAKPISDANRLHFAKRCADEANNLTPGLGDTALAMIAEGEAHKP